MSPDSSSNTRRDRLHAILLIAILALAAFLRLRNLAKQSIWYDESATVEIVRKPWSELTHAIIVTENTPPAYYAFLKVWCDLFGVSELVLRLPSALMGVASVFFLYRLVRYCAGSTEGLIAALLLSCSEYHIWYSQEARAYSMLLLVSVWSCDEFVRMIDGPRSQAREIRYWISIVLLLYVHLYGVFTILAQCIYFVWRRCSRWKSQLNWSTFLQLQISAAVIFAIWTPAMRRWLRGHLAMFQPQAATAVQIPASYALYLAKSHDRMLLLAAALIVIGTGRKQLWPKLGMLILLLLTPVIVPVIVSALTHPLYMPRYGLVAMAGLFGLIACGIARLPSVAKPLLLCVMCPVMLLSPEQNRRPPFREIAHYLNRYLQPGDFIVISAPFQRGPLRYYLDHPDIPIHTANGSALPLGLPLPTPTAHVWLVLVDPLPKINGAPIIQRGHWRVVSQENWGPDLVLELADGSVDSAHALPDNVRFHSRPPTTQRSETVVKTHADSD